MGVFDIIKMLDVIVSEFYGHLAYVSKILTLRIQYLPTAKYSIMAFESHRFSPRSALNTLGHERIGSNSY